MKVTVQDSTVIINGEPQPRARVFANSNPHILMITGSASPKLGVSSGKGGQLRVTIAAGPVIKELAKRAGVEFYGKTTVTAFAVDKRNSKGESIIVFNIDGKATPLTLEEMKSLNGTFRLVLEGGYVATKKNQKMWALKLVEGVYFPQITEQENELLFFDEFYDSMML